MKKALAFFGAFNPPTTAHLELARYALEQTGRESVVFVPSRSAYIREEQGKDYAYSDRARLAMLRAAREKRPWMAVTDYELTLDHQPRSYETLCRLKEEGYEAALLMGSDKLAELETGWKYVREIAEEFGIVCMERAEDDCGEIIRNSAFLTELMPYITVLKTPEETKNISSTQVRELITRGETPEGLVPGEILELLGTEKKEHAMKLEPIITSLLDTDLYKFNMDQVIFHKHTDLSGEYYFRCRNEGVVFTPEMFEEINAQIDHLCSLTFTKEELDYLRSIRFLKSDYVEFLRLWRPIRDYVETRLTKDGTLKIVVRGPLFSAMQFEIYLLEIVNEVYFRLKYDYAALRKSAEERLNEKIRAFQEGKYTFSFAEFGCRRRLSREWEDEVVRRLATETTNCVGTSNVMLAKKYGLKPIGTYAHEFVQMYQGIDSIPLAYTNHYALEDWYNEYRGDNGTALTDTVTTDLFLLDFNRAMVNNFTGVRHDSGDPYEWGEKMIAHYKKYGADPKTKLLLFSDSLDFDRAQALYEYFKDRAKVSFGIGTFCSNDTSEEALNIVIKLQTVNGRAVAKLSDSAGKTMCRDDEYMEYLERSVAFRLNREKEAE